MLVSRCRKRCRNLPVRPHCNLFGLRCRAGELGPRNALQRPDRARKL